MIGKILDSNGSELIVLEEGSLYCFGRQKGETGSGLLIDDIFVSRKHAVVGYDRGYYIRDTKSTNGTFVNDRRLNSGESCPLVNGDVFRLADRVYRFTESDEDEEPGATGAAEGSADAEKEIQDEVISHSEAVWSSPEKTDGSMSQKENDNESEKIKKAHPPEEAENEARDQALEAASAAAERTAFTEGEEELENESGAWGPFKYSLRSSAAGRRLYVETGKRGCIEYQVRMIEENPELMTAEVIHVRNIDSDCFLCKIEGRFALKDYLKKERKRIDGIELVDRILKLVKLGEEHMLERDKYLLTPSTIFMDNNGDLLLTYIPHMEKKNGCFSRGMGELCRLLAEIYRDQKAGLQAMAGVFSDDNLDTRECIKHVYHYKTISLPELSQEKKKPGGFRINIRYMLTLASFIVFMAVFWLCNLNYVNLGGIFLLLAGGNVLLYNSNKGVGKNEKRMVHN